MHTSRMLDASPQPRILPNEPLARCIDACFDGAQACGACADACLGEPQVDQLRWCIRLNHDCADVCIATGRVLSRQQDADVQIARVMLESCVLACQVCGDECARHAQYHAHCRVCAEACRACAKACQDALGGLRHGPRELTH